MTIGGCAGSPGPQAAVPAPVKAVSASVPSGATPTPEPVKPTGNAVNVHKIKWGKAKVVGRNKVKLTWWSGVAPCTVLHRVKVKETSRRVTITLYEGTAPKAQDVSCIMIAVEKTTTVKLKHPVGHRKIVDGGKL
ncbi:hypothetical protein ACIBG8_27830 [Nonomuraea sp. NPDC050556]|uniref:hypothetical protein n=1 Tax=Nonomuraea sp. NPDC050556 TaxID=3364369 RepID=UPI0037B1C0FF